MAVPGLTELFLLGLIALVGLAALGGLGLVIYLVTRNPDRK